MPSPGSLPRQPPDLDYLGESVVERTGDVVVIGAGPAGLMAAETAAHAGRRVTLIEGRRSAGRKLVLAGRSGLNLTHNEPLDEFLGRYGEARSVLEPAILEFGPEALRSWADQLDAETFVGSSGRVFPRGLRATPLLRRWLTRLETQGVQFLAGQWHGWDPDGTLRIGRTGGDETWLADATVLALGGASWPRVGGDGSWVEALRAGGIEVRELTAANCGALVAWTPRFVERFAGAPLKNVAVSVAGRSIRGEPVVTADGLEGGPIYAHTPALRAQLAIGAAVINIDLHPDLTEKQVALRLSERRRKKDSVSTWLRRGGVHPIGVSLMRDVTGNDLPRSAARMAVLLKRVPITVHSLSPIDRAISSAGGVALAEVDDTFMLCNRPGVFVAGEMLDWEAPTGGYLLQACFSTGRAAGVGAAAWRPS